MRTSLITIVMMMVVSTAFFTLVAPSSGIAGPSTAQVKDLGAVSPVQNDPVTEDFFGNEVAPSPEQTYFPYEEPEFRVTEGPSVPWPFDPKDPAPTRGAVNTSTLLYIQKASKSVTFGDRLELEGLLLEDNNSDGERNSGDEPIIKEWVKILWADGTEWMQDISVETEWQSEELNLTAGRWSVPTAIYGPLHNDTFTYYLNANITSIESNPVELVITYFGVWTVDGARFYNLTQEIYDAIAPTKKGFDDDGDAAQMQSNSIDDDLDGVVDDGRPGIPAVGTPEPPALYNNGLDDDGDGVRDDGRPAIRIEGTSEGVDEEKLNGQDDDGDGDIDEDTDAFIARRGCEKRLYVEIWHKTKLTTEVKGPDLIDIGGTYTIKGTIRDTSWEETYMGEKVVRVFFDGQPKTDVKTKQSLSGFHSEFEVSLRIDEKIEAGPHKVTVEFSPGYDASRNMFFYPSNASVTINVRRPTIILFEESESGFQWAYRGTTVFINGTIVDRYKWENDKIIEGPRLKIAGTDYSIEYTYKAWWGEPQQVGVYQPLNTVPISDDNGSFSIPYDIPPEHPLGPVTITIKTDWDLLRTSNPLMYYSWANNGEGSSTVVKIRAGTTLSLWLDQNKQNGDDEAEGLNSFITRKPFKDATGKVFDWNVARVRGKLVDRTQSSGGYTKGVDGKEISFTWNFGKTNRQVFTTETKDGGLFSFDISIQPTAVLGPVPIRAAFDSDINIDYFDSSTYVDVDGMPFSIVSYTTLDINTTTGIKGKAVQVSGNLKDDQEAGIGDKTVQIYRLTSYDGNYNSLFRPGGLGKQIGTATTNSAGRLTFTDYVLEESMSVGSVWIVAKFDGSVQFPPELGGIRYLPNDAFMPKVSTPTKLTITSETVLALDKVPNIIIRGEQVRLTGKLLESFQGKPQTSRGVAAQTINAYIKQGDELIYLGSDSTKNDPTIPEFNGFFDIKGTVPANLRVGTVELLVEFTPAPGSEGVTFYQSARNITRAQIWSSTRIKEVAIGPLDIDSDRRIDLLDDRIDQWFFTFQVVEGTVGATSREPEPVTYGEVWLNITMGVYSNTTKLITDIRGRVHFNFTSIFKDTATGNQFKIQSVEKDAREQNMTIDIKFIGKQDYRFSSKTILATYHNVPQPSPPPPPWLLIFLVILIVLILVAIGLYFFYKYIEKKRRLKALKKIIKKAADQLEAGNPYSYVIFKAYQKMGAHLRKYGFLRRDADTFREFEDAVRVALPVDEKNLDSFLDILEEARYSKHLIGEAHKEKALGSLNSVLKSLDTVMLDEEAALRQMEMAEEEYTDTEIVDASRKGA
ncbi:MAG: DUF4129 domain-containing protein [Candidatus Thermoplasmatota archaeon]|jgi:hypothetical protein|nr:DUF4129 domain-containing protein [Candidatus Thermoplasmatota archaeon]